MTNFKIKGIGSVQITAYNVNSFLILIHEHSGGWEIYAPVTDTNQIDETFKAAERRLGLVEQVAGGERHEGHIPLRHPEVERRECELGTIAAVGPFSDEIMTDGD